MKAEISSEGNSENRLKPSYSLIKRSQINEKSLKKLNTQDSNNV